MLDIVLSSGHGRYPALRYPFHSPRVDALQTKLQKFSAPSAGKNGMKQSIGCVDSPEPPLRKGFEEAASDGAAGLGVELLYVKNLLQSGDFCFPFPLI